MKLTYSLDEVFEIAEQIERNGAAFYRKAAEMADSEMTAKFLLYLADQENAHEKSFAEVRDALVDADTQVIKYDKDDVVVSYLRAVAGQYVFDSRQGPEDLLTGHESMPDILDMAIQQEKDSIVFYLGIVNVTSDGNDRAKVKLIMAEEQAHLAELIAKKNTV